MKYVIYILMLLFAISGFASPLKEKNTSKRAVFMSIKSEARVIKNKIDKNNRKWYPLIPYTEVALNYKTNKHRFLLELSAEQETQGWSLGFGEISATYSFHFIPLEVKGGYLPLPLGYRKQNQYLFSREFSFYPVLEAKTEDLALTANFKTIKDFLTLQGTVFGGWAYRPSDKLSKPPDSLPFIISLKSEGPFWSAFASWFQKDPAFLEPLQALGGGFRLKHSDKNLKLFFQSAFWFIREKEQSSIVFYGHPALTIYKVTLGMAIGSLNRFFPHFGDTEVESALYDRGFYMAVQAHPNIKLIGEHYIGGQEQGPLTRDLWAFRVQMHFDF